MERHSKDGRMSWGHGLMYRIGVLLIAGGIPGAIEISFGGMFDRNHLPFSEALLAAVALVGTILIVATVLIFAAKKSTK